jgi:hypothetical protein
MAVRFDTCMGTARRGLRFGLRFRRLSVGALAATLVLLACLATGCGSSEAAPCDDGHRLGDKPPLAQRKEALRTVLQLPFVHRLLKGQPPTRATVSTYVAPRSHRAVGIAVWITFPRRPRKEVTDEVWPFLVVDNTGTADPPYEVLQTHVRARGMFMIEVTLLPPLYRRGGVTNWGAFRIDVVDPLTRSRLPEQLPHCAD